MTADGALVYDFVDVLTFLRLSEGGSRAPTRESNTIDGLDFAAKRNKSTLQPLTLLLIIQTCERVYIRISIFSLTRNGFEDLLDERIAGVD